MFAYQPRNDFEFQPRQFNPNCQSFSLNIKSQREARDPDIFVTNILQGISKQKFIDAFSKHGEIAGVSIKARYDNGMTKGQLAYIWCKSPEDRDNILLEAENDTEIAKMFFIRPVIKQYEKRGEKKNLSPPKDEEKLNNLFSYSCEPKDEYEFSQVAYKNRDDTRDILVDCLNQIKIDDAERVKIINEYLDEKKINLKSIEYPLRKMKVSKDEVLEIFKILTNQ